jgi:hypothetical protein
MNHPLMHTLSKLQREAPVTIACILALGTLGIDFITGQNIHFPVLYLLPIGLLAWNQFRKVAYLFAILLPSTRIILFFLWGEKQFLTNTIINAAIASILLLFISYLINIISRQHIQLKRKVKTLEGILPICSICKKIRNKDGRYEALEGYITNHSEALFSHGFCPECAQKFYPEYFQKKNGHGKSTGLNSNEEDNDEQQEQ